MKDIIIGGASNYTWNELRYWVNSIKKSGFEGDIALCMTNVTKETIDILRSKDVKLFLYGTPKSDGSYVHDKKEVSHVERFAHIFHYLSSTREKYRYVITTDTRDVIFQNNPSTWLENNLNEHKIVCSSEGLIYENEPWGNKNLLDAFGDYFHDMLKREVIYNVGTIAGEFKYVRDLLLMIFQMSINRPIPIVDQAVFNFLINFQPYKEMTRKTTHKDGWAVQLGTSPQGVKSGSGDIGYVASQNPTEYIKYQMNYLDKTPIIENDIVMNQDRIPFTIVHQYDRVKELSPAIKSIYE